MTSRSGLRQSHVLGLTILFVVLVTVAVSAVLLVQDPNAKPRSIRVGDSLAHTGWQTIAYRDAQVDVPGDWKRADLSTCGFEADGWAPESASQDGSVCQRADGVFFYAEETFDPAQGPGEVATTADGQHAGGYEVAGHVAVSAKGERAVVEQILTSVKKR